MLKATGVATRRPARVLISCRQEEYLFIVVVQLGNAAPRSVDDAVMCPEDGRCKVDDMVNL